MLNEKGTVARPNNHSPRPVLTELRPSGSRTTLVDSPGLSHCEAILPITALVVNNRRRPICVKRQNNVVIYQRAKTQFQASRMRVAPQTEARARVDVKPNKNVVRFSLSGHRGPVAGSGHRRLKHGVRRRAPNFRSMARSPASGSSVLARRPRRSTFIEVLGDVIVVRNTHDINYGTTAAGPFCVCGPDGAKAGRQKPGKRFRLSPGFAKIEASHEKSPWSTGSPSWRWCCRCAGGVAGIVQSVAVGRRTPYQTFIFWAISSLIFVLMVTLRVFILFREGVKLYVERQSNRKLAHQDQAGGGRPHPELPAGHLPRAFQLEVMNHSLEAWFRKPADKTRCGCLSSLRPCSSAGSGRSEYAGRVAGRAAETRQLLADGVRTPGSSTVFLRSQVWCRRRSFRLGDVPLDSSGPSTPADDGRGPRAPSPKVER